MKWILCIVLIFSAVFAKAAGYYINPSSDSTAEKGTIKAPWKSLAVVNANMRMFKPGDTIFIKRGELYFERLKITCSGTEKAPIVFMTYGSAKENPVFLFRDPQEDGDYVSIHLFKASFIVIDGFTITDDNMDKEDHSRTANIAIAVNIDESNSITIKNLDISLVGVGVNMLGSMNTVDKCKIRNLRMIKNTVGGDDDYGANPVVIAGAGNTISNNYFEGCWANSYDYTFDGGAIEIFGSVTDNNKIVNNTAINCDGFMEIGSLSGGSSNNILVSNNTIINCGELVYMSTGGKYKIAVNNLQFFNNYIIHSVNQLTNPKSMIGMQTPISDPGIINLQGNIFWLLTGIDVARPGQFNGSQMTHKNNMYYLSSGKLNFTPDASESIITKDTPQARKIFSRHPYLSNLEAFPFIYLPYLLNKFIY